MFWTAIHFVMCILQILREIFMNCPTHRKFLLFHLFCRGLYKVFKKCMYVLWFQRLFPYQMIFVSFNSKATKTTSETRSAGPSRVRFRFQWDSYCSNFSFCVVFCDPFLISSYFFLLLYCLSFLDLWLLVALWYM